MPVLDHCKYLGYEVGPGRKELSWHKPLQQFLDRVLSWQRVPLGLHWSTKIYNMFMVPTLGYISQLEIPPDWVLRETADSLHRAAPGPKDWCSCEDLWQLNESLGLNCSFKEVGTLAKAIQSRVLHWDRAFACK